MKKYIIFALFIAVSFVGIVSTAQAAPSFTITSPNGGENWEPGKSYTITWDQQNVDKLTIYLMKTSSVTQDTIISNYAVSINASTGSYTYNVPSNVAEADTYKIWAIAYQTGTGSTSDWSDNAFSIEVPTALASVTVASPNGGGDWEIGKSYNISWTSTDLSAPIGVYLSGYDEFGGTYVAYTIASNLINTSSYNWSIPSTIKNDKYLIRVVAYPNDKSKSFEDYSDSSFNIVAASPVVDAVKITAGSHPSATLAVEGAIIPFTTFTVDPEGKYVFLDRVNVSKSSGFVDNAFEKFVLIANTSSSANTGAQKQNDKIIASSNYSGWLNVSSLFGAFNSQISFTIAGVIKQDISAYAGITRKLNLSGVDAHWQDGKDMSISGNFPMEGTSQTLNSSLEIGKLYAQITGTDNKLSLRASEKESIRLKKIFFNPNGGSSNGTIFIESTGMTYSCGSIEAGLIICDFGSGIVISKNSSILLKPSSANWFSSLPDLLDIVATGETYGYRIAVQNDTQIIVPTPTPSISYLSSSSGLINASITIKGSGFTNNNDIVFVGSINKGAPIEGERHFNSVSSSDGKTLSFQIPSAITRYSESGNNEEISVVPGKYYVIVSNENGKSDIAYLTVISTSVSSSIAVISPNGGETLNWPDAYQIKWNSSNIKSVSIALYKNNSFFNWIATNIIAGSNNKYSWIPSKTISEANVGNNIFKIYILGYKTGGGTIADFSDILFSIKSTTVSTPTVLSPKLTVILPIPIQTSATTIFTRNMWRGMRGNDVKKLQQLFNSDSDLRIAETGLGSPGNETNYYGFLTMSAVQNFQCKYGIVCLGAPDSTGYGVVGPKTRKKLEEVFGKTTLPQTSTEIPASSIQIESATTPVTTSLQERINQMLKQLKEMQKQLQAMQGALLLNAF